MSGPARVLVAGAGPTGLTLALQARALGASVRVIDRREDRFRPSRALILHPRTLEVLRPLGVTPAILERADTAPGAQLHLGRRVVAVRLTELAMAGTAFPHLTLVRQMDIEEVLAAALAARGAEVERGTELVRATNAGDRASASLRRGNACDEAQFDFVVGCDGPDSAVRASADFGWRGGSYREEVLLADLELRGELDDGVAHVVAGREGLLFLFNLGEQATWRLLATRPTRRDSLPFGRPGPPVPLPELQGLIQEAGLDARISELVWSARYRVQHRMADRFRQDRLFIAGDAAHAYSPATGNGMNTGIQDAANLGWKLAFAPRATDLDALLDSYDCERRPAARRVLAMTRLGFWAEASTSLVPSLLRGVVAPLAAPALPVLSRQRLLVAEVLRQVGQLRLAYTHSPLSAEGGPPLPSGPAPGRRLPDATVTVDGQPARLHALLARPGVHLLLQRDAPSIEPGQLGPYVTTHRLSAAPGSGQIAVRPDGYVGFRGGAADPAPLLDWLSCIGALPLSGTRRDSASLMGTPTLGSAPDELGRRA